MTIFSSPFSLMEMGDFLHALEMIVYYVLILGVFANPHAKAFRKRKEKVRERSQISAIDWPNVKKAIEPAVRLGGCDLAQSCLFWATIGKEYLKHKVALDTRIWKGKAGVSWVKHSNTEIRAKQKAYLKSVTEVEKSRTGKSTSYHVWLESKEYIIDLALYCNSEPCPDNLLIIRRAEPTVYYYIPECEVLPKVANGYSEYEVAGFRFAIAAKPRKVFEGDDAFALA